MINLSGRLSNLFLLREIHSFARNNSNTKQKGHENAKKLNTVIELHHDAVWGPGFSTRVGN